MNITLTGVFDNHSKATEACKELEAAGIEKQAIHISGVPADAGSSGPAPMSGKSREGEGIISGIFSELFGANDEADAANFSESVRRGNAVVTVNVADDSSSEEISEILEACGALDIHQSVAEWKTTGYTPPAGAQQESNQSGATEDPLGVVQEELKIGKQTVEHGGVSSNSFFKNQV